MAQQRHLKLVCYGTANEQEVRNVPHQPEFPETFLPGVARAADRAMQEVLDEGATVDAFLAREIPVGLHPRRPVRR